MPNTPTGVSLDIRNSPANGDGWTSVGASNGATYSYKYGGGPTNDGNLTFAVGGGNAAITLSMVADNRYHIQNIGFTGNDAGQLTVQGNAPRMRVINDSCTGPLDAQYKVTVLDTTANATIPCDPAIKNVPTR